VSHSKSIAFCTDCQRPISAGAMRCSRCAGAANRGVARAAVAPRPRPQAETKRERWRALTDAEQVAIRTWRYGVSVAEIARIRASQSAATAPSDPSRHSA
jgi:hypothetical protein